MPVMRKERPGVLVGVFTVAWLVAGCVLGGTWVNRSLVASGDIMSTLGDHEPHDYPPAPTWLPVTFFAILFGIPVLIAVLARRGGLSRTGLAFGLIPAFVIVAFLAGAVLLAR